MPIGLSPNNTIRVSLDTDLKEHADDKTRPAFVVKFLTANERIRLKEAFKQHDAAPDVEKAKILVDALRIGVLRWENIPTLTWENMADVLTYDELDELTTKVQRETRLTEAERGKSVSAQPSPASCAESAAKPVGA